ncbi:MAG TPA: aminoacetone oxidase family FAD-binding enzyme [Gemmatimonadales bacterium]|nr:aminoacetone oxidase family FAD-binding enzyme [Gemmatimonadales bacterium]
MTGLPGATVVIGAGAAGIIAAGHAARHGPVTLLERTRDGGRKILISGGGRCNVLPSELSPALYITASSPNIVRNIFRSWPLDAQRQFFERDLGIPLKLEPESGKLFPVSDKARQVRDGLLAWAAGQGARVEFDRTVVGLDRPPGSGWRVALGGGEALDADKVIIATGGLSVPQTGSDGTGLRLLRALGHTIHDTYPALTPLTLDPPVYAGLAGLSLDVTIRSGEGRGAFVTTGGFLFTHRGYSGPAVLNASHLVVRARLARQVPPPLEVQWTPLDASAWGRELAGGTAHIGSVLKRHLPERLTLMLLGGSAIDPGSPLSQLRREERERVIRALTRWPLPVTSDEGYKKAEVTGGGVALDEIVPRTMESRSHRGLFICGEALDCFGPIGGYNFAWAWVTGRAAGIAAGSG